MSSSCSGTTRKSRSKKLYAEGFNKRMSHHRASAVLGTAPYTNHSNRGNYRGRGCSQDRGFLLCSPIQRSRELEMDMRPYDAPTECLWSASTVERRVVMVLFGVPVPSLLPLRSKVGLGAQVRWLKTQRSRSDAALTAVADDPNTPARETNNLWPRMRKHSPPVPGMCRCLAILLPQLGLYAMSRLALLCSAGDPGRNSNG